MISTGISGTLDRGPDMAGQVQQQREFYADRSVQRQAVSAPEVEDRARVEPPQHRPVAEEPRRVRERNPVESTEPVEVPEPAAVKREVAVEHDRIEVPQPQLRHFMTGSGNAPGTWIQKYIPDVSAPVFKNGILYGRRIDPAQSVINKRRIAAYKAAKAVDSPNERRLLHRRFLHTAAQLARG